MADARCTNLDFSKHSNSILCLWLFDIFWDSLKLFMGYWGAMYPYYPVGIDYVLP